MYGKCRDCGNEFDPSKEHLIKRDDVCDGCADRRDALLRALENGLIDMDVFRGIQRQMANGRGTAKATIVSVLAKAIHEETHGEDPSQSCG